MSGVLSELILDLGGEPSVLNFNMVVATHKTVGTDVDWYQANGSYWAGASDDGLDVSRALVYGSPGWNVQWGEAARDAGHAIGGTFSYARWNKGWWLMYKPDEKKLSWEAGNEENGLNEPGTFGGNTRFDYPQLIFMEISGG